MALYVLAFIVASFHSKQSLSDSKNPSPLNHSERTKLSNLTAYPSPIYYIYYISYILVSLGELFIHSCSSEMTDLYAEKPRISSNSLTR